jgi:hypothetical protein
MYSFQLGNYQNVEEHMNNGIADGKIKQLALKLKLR